MLLESKKFIYLESVQIDSFFSLSKLIVPDTVLRIQEAHIFKRVSKLIVPETADSLLECRDWNPSVTLTFAKLFVKFCSTDLILR